MQHSTDKVLSFETLVENSKNFFYAIPTEENKIENIAGNDSEKKQNIVRQAKTTRIIVREKVLNLIDAFLDVKRNYGSNIEKQLYREMTRDEFIKRLILKRTLSFLGVYDLTLLRDGRQPNGEEWLKVGTDCEASIHLSDYLSYDEMQISALIGVSTPSYFINSGDRRNKAVKGIPGTFQEEGIVVALVGARMMKEDKMEYQHMIISSTHSTTEKGYGKKAVEKFSRETQSKYTSSWFTLPGYFTGKPNRLQLHNYHLLQIWAKFYGLQHGDDYYFYSYEEFMTEGNLHELKDKFIPLLSRNVMCNMYFNVYVYEKRIEILAETLLLEANLRGKEAKRNVYLRVVGFGLGNWRIHETQTAIVIECFVDTIHKLKLPFISTIDFSWFDESFIDNSKLREASVMQSDTGNRIDIKFSKSGMAEKIASDELLVTTYAWEANSFPGNDYWLNSLSSSGDPAAACCSTIPQLQNPYINPFFDNIQIL